MAVVSPPTPREAVPDHKIPPGAFEPLVAPRSGYVKDPEAELWLALQANKEEDIQYYGAAVDLKSMVHSMTPLHYAAVYGNWEVVAFLMTHGADRGAKTKKAARYPGGYTPADLASSEGLRGFLSDRDANVVATKFHWQGIERMRQQRYENSIALFLRSLQHDQTRCVTHIALGNAYASLQQIDNAMESYKRAIYYEPSNSEPYWLRAMLMQGDPAKYISHLEEILENFPSDVMAAYNIGVAQVQLNRVTEAIEAFDRVLWTDPRHMHALGQKALLLYNMGDAITAYALLKAALEDEPTTQPYAQALPVVEAAATEMKKRIDAKYDELYIEGVKHMHGRKWADSINTFGQLIKLKPTDDRGFWGMGLSLWRSGQDGDAAAYFEKAVQLNASSQAVVDLKLLQRARAIRQREQLLNFERDQHQKIEATKFKIQETKAKLGLDATEAERAKYQDAMRQILDEKAKLENELKTSPEYVRIKCIYNKKKKAFRVHYNFGADDNAVKFLKELRERFNLEEDDEISFQMLDVSSMTQTKMTEEELPKKFMPHSDAQLLVYS